MRPRSPRHTPCDGGRPLSEVLAWQGLEGGGWLRGADGALTTTIEVAGPRPGVALTEAAAAAGRLGAGWGVLAELQHLAGDDHPPRTRAYLTLTRRPGPAATARRAAVGRQRRRQDLIEADLQLLGDVEARLERIIRRPTAARYALRRLDGRRMVRYLHATLTGRRPARGTAGAAGLDRLLSGVRLHRDGGLRCGGSHIVPVLATPRRTPGDRDPLAPLGGLAGTVRVVLRPAARRRAAGWPRRQPLTVRDLLTHPAAGRPVPRGDDPSPGLVLVAYGEDPGRAARRAAGLVARLRGAGVAARVEETDPAALFLASLPASGPAHKQVAEPVRMQAQRPPDDR